jgi:hypothetical protein
VWTHRSPADVKAAPDGPSLIARRDKDGGVDVMAALIEHGMLLASARGPLPNVAALVAGEPIKGSWWAHPRGHEIFNTLSDLDDSPDVVRLRLVNGKVTLVHRRLWPALVRVADRFTPKQLAVLHEEHTATGAHRVHEQPFPEWVPDGVALAAARLSVAEALAQLPPCLAT